MPIRPDLLKFYGPEWQNVTRPRILDRAGHRCEHCGKPNHVRVETRSYTMPVEGHETPRLHLMFWRDAECFAPGDSWIYRDGRPSSRANLNADSSRFIKVVLTVAHLNHVAGDDRDENLAALCQWCHLVYDLEHHEESRSVRKDSDRPLLQLLSESTTGIEDGGPGHVARASFI